MEKLEQKIQKNLFSMQDLGYQKFQRSLMPTVSPDRVIGVRTPMLRKYAAQLAKTGEGEAFMKLLPHQYYEENNLHSYLIEKIRDYERAVYEVELFLPYVDNWATCDTLSPKVFGKNREALLEKIKGWVSSGSAYTVRFGLGMLMRFYLDEGFKQEYLELAASVHGGEEYYVNMMIAWFFATALAKQFDAAFPYIAEKRLEPWVHNKAIQKAVESRRLSGEEKILLRKYKV